MGQSLEFTIQEINGDSVVASAVGTLNVEGTTVLKTEYQKVIGKHKNLVLDLSGVSFVSSSGVGALIVANEDFQNVGGRFVLANLSPELSNVFKLLELDEVLEIAYDAQDAINRLAA